MCHCLEVSHSGYYAWRNRGMSNIPQSAVEELAIFVTYFFNESKQTHLLYTGPQSLGTRVVLQPVPRDGAPAHAAWRAWRGCQPAPRPTTTVPAADLAGRPDLIEKEASRLMHQFRKLVGDINLCSHPGRIRVPGRP